MELQQLEYFRCVAQLEHMTRASEKLNISQPALTASIQRLEGDLSVKLFERNGRNITLTSYGKIYLHYVQEALDNLKKGRQELENEKRKKEERVRLLAPPMQSFPGLLENILAYCPMLFVENVKELSNDIAQYLSSHKIDLCISSHIVNSDKVNSTILTTENMVVITAKKHPLANEKEVSLSQLVNENFASLSHDTGPHAKLLEKCASFGFTPNIIFEGYNLIDIISSVRTGQCIAVTTGELLRKHTPELAQDVKQIRIANEDCQLVRRLYWRTSDDNKYMTQVVRQVIIDYFKERY